MRIICHPKFAGAFHKFDVIVQTSLHTNGVQMIDDAGEVRNLSIEELKPDRLKKLIESSKPVHVFKQVKIGRAHGAKFL